MALIASTAIDGLPNIGMNMDIVSVTATTNGDFVEMSTYGYATVYMAVAVTSANVATTCTISDSTQVNLTGGAAMGAGKILVIGV